jgi:hypothetical protein
MDRAITTFVERRYEPVIKVGNGTVFRLRPSGQVLEGDAR